MAHKTRRSRSMGFDSIATYLRNSRCLVDDEAHGRQIYDNYKHSSDFLCSTEGQEFLNRIKRGSVASAVNSDSLSGDSQQYQAVVMRPKQHHKRQNSTQICVNGRCIGDPGEELSPKLSNHTVVGRERNGDFVQRSSENCFTKSNENQSYQVLDCGRETPPRGGPACATLLGCVPVPGSFLCNQNHKERSVTGASANCVASSHPLKSPRDAIKRRASNTTSSSDYHSQSSTNESIAPEPEMLSSRYASAALCAKLPLTETTKQLHFAASVNPVMDHDCHSVIDNNYSMIDSPTARGQPPWNPTFSCAADGDDIDSDEEPPPPPLELCVYTDHFSDDLLSEAFPSPPSPLNSPPSLLNRRSNSIPGCAIRLSETAAQNSIFPIDPMKSSYSGSERLCVPSTPTRQRNGNPNFDVCDDALSKLDLNSLPHLTSGFPVYNNSSSCNTVGPVYVDLPPSISTDSYKTPTYGEFATNYSSHSLNSHSSSVYLTPGSLGNRTNTKMDSREFTPQSYSRYGPPPPPKRDLSTRLTTVRTDQSLTACTPNGISSANSSPLNGCATPPANRRKLVVPSVTVLERQNSEQLCYQKNQNPPYGVFLPNHDGLINDLQNAMQRRQRQVLDSRHSGR